MAISLVSPLNDLDVVGNVLIFTFEIPFVDSTSQNLRSKLTPFMYPVYRLYTDDKLVFRLALDTNNPINPSSLHYKEFESRLSSGSNQNGRWEFFKDNAWSEIPASGIRPSNFGQKARVQVRKQDTTNYLDVDSTSWYWEISSGIAT